MDKRIIRVFPRRTNATPDDALVRVHETPSFFDEADEVYIDGERCTEQHASGFAGPPKERDRQRSGNPYTRNSFDRFPTQSPVCCGNDGLPAGLDGITFPAWCRQSIKAYGNAIVPQVFYRIAETINEYERL